MIKITISYLMSYKPRYHDIYSQLARKILHNLFTVLCTSYTLQALSYCSSIQLHRINTRVLTTGLSTITTNHLKISGGEAEELVQRLSTISLYLVHTVSEAVVPAGVLHPSQDIEPAAHCLLPAAVWGGSTCTGRQSWYAIDYVNQTYLLLSLSG